MKKTNYVLVLLMALCFSSCMTTRTPVGNFSSTPGQEYVFDKGKQCYLFWGLIPLGRKNVNTPIDGNCEVRTRMNFWDGLVYVITAGIFDMQTIRVYAKPKLSAAADEITFAPVDANVPMDIPVASIVQ